MTATLTINQYDAALAAMTANLGTLNVELSSANHLVYSNGDALIVVTGTGLIAGGASGPSGGTVTGITLELASNPGTILATISNFTISVTANSAINTFGIPGKLYALGTTASIAHGSDIVSATSYLTYIAQQGVNTLVGPITVIDNVVPIYTVSQAFAFANETAVLQNLSTGFAISDASTATAGNGATWATILGGGGGQVPVANLVSLTLTDNGIITGIQLPAASILSKLHNADGTPYKLGILDSPTNNALNISQLEALWQAGHIISVGTGNTTAGFTIAQALQGVDILHLLAQPDNPHQGYALVDSAAHIIAAADTINSWLQTDTHVSISPDGPFPVSVATLFHVKSVDTLFLSTVAANLNYSFAVTDSAANVSANAAALSTATKTSVAVSDTAAHISANLDALENVATIATLVLTDTTVLPVSATQLANDGAVISKLAGGETIGVTDTSASLNANFAYLYTYRSLTSSITISDVSTGPIKVNADHLSGNVDFSSTLSKVIGPYTLSITDPDGVIYTLGSNVGKVILTGVGFANITGNVSGDTFVANTGADTFHGDVGTDTVDYSSFTAPITVQIQAGDGTVVKSGTIDTLTSIENFVTGSATDTFMLTNSVGRTIDGGGGADAVDYGASTVSVHLNVGTGLAPAPGYDRLVHIENITGSGLADAFAMSDATDQTVNGGAGADLADYSAAMAAVTVTLSTSSNGTASGADVGSDTLISIENITGGVGNDTFFGDSNDNVLAGDGGDDTLFGGAGHDILDGGDGNDTLVGNADVFAQESDTLNGGAGNDTILGEFTDTIDGGSGTDFLYAVNSYDWNINLGATSIEWMSAGFGNDTIDASTQTAGVTIYASGGNDVLTGSNQGDFLWAGVGDDTVNGGGGDDVIVGDLGADSLSGGDGNDSIYTDGVDTLLDGGNGTDALYVVGGSGLNINLAATHFEWFGDYAGGNDTVDASGNTADTVVYAGAGNDLITGGTGNDFLWGEAGNDTITGGAGSDTLVGGTGADNLTGGTGVDTIFCSSGGGGDGAVDTVFYTATAWGTDFIYDFEHGTDKINMQGTGAAAGTITINNVGGNAQVHFGSDLIVVVGVGATLNTGDFVF